MEVTDSLSDKGKRDYNLIQEARKGNQKAFAELMANYYNFIYYSMLKMTPNNFDAEDLTIEAFTKAFKNLENYTPEYAFSSWLYKIATNNAIDFLRSKNKASSVNAPSVKKNITGESDKTMADKHENPEELIIHKEKSAFIHEVVNQMKPHYASLITLRYFHDYSYEEIAQELNIPLGTVKVRLYRAKELLFNMLKNSEDNF